MKKCKVCGIDLHGLSRFYCSKTCNSKNRNIKRISYRKEIKNASIDDMTLPKNMPASIKLIKFILGVHNPSFIDRYVLRCIFQNDIDNGLSAKNINEKYNINYKSNFGSFLTTIGVKLLSQKESVINFYNKNTKYGNDKESYFRKCKFKFTLSKDIKGFILTEQYDFVDHNNKIDGKKYLHKDHMVSIHYGWTNNIPAEHISHPANCHIIFEEENLKKGKNCSITYQELLILISNW